MSKEETPRRVVFQATNIVSEKGTVKLKKVGTVNVDRRTEDGTSMPAVFLSCKPNAAGQYILQENAQRWHEQYKALKGYAKKYGWKEVKQAGEKPSAAPAEKPASVSEKDDKPKTGGKKDDE